MKLYTKILIGLVAGILVGWLLSLGYQEAPFRAADTNEDQKLSPEEISLAKAPISIYKDTALLAAVDLNNDGQISVSEDKKKRGAQRFAKYISPVGEIFIRLIKMVVIPLILASLILGVANLGDIKRLGRIGLRAFGFFMLTTTVAVSIGIGMANLLRPGDGLPKEKQLMLTQEYAAQVAKTVESSSKEPAKSEVEKIIDLVVNMVPKNPIKALAEGDMLAVIFFSIFFGVCLTLVAKERAKPFIEVMEGLNEVVLKMITLAMELAPYGVFALLVGVVSDMGVDILVPLFKYAGVVLLALLVHVALTHGSFIVFYLRKNPFEFLRAIKEAIVLGFGTSSSSATLPISMNVSEANLGVSRQVSSFVLPLGATINMDGTALYQGVAAIFIAQVYDIPLSFIQQLVMVLTATLASVGAAGVPGAGMITLAVVLGTAGVPVEGIVLILGIDRLIDMFRTVINIIGDITCAAVMAKAEGEKILIRRDHDIIEG